MNLENLSHNELVLMAQQGKEKEKIFEILYYKWNKAIKSHALKLCSNEMDAEGIVQDTFTKAFKKIHQYKPTHAFTTWLYRIATNDYIDKYRKKKKDPLENGNDLIDLGEIHIELYDSPEEEMIKEEKYKKLKSYVENLSDRYRGLTKSFYFDQLSYKEIAEKFNLPEGTVKAQLFRAREILKKQINGNIPNFYK